MIRIISANLNGIRSAQKKGFFDWMIRTNADVICVQETKAQLDDLSNLHTAPGEYSSWFECAAKRGYSGVALFSKTQPLHIEYGTGNAEFDAEGRMITAEFDNTLISSIYFPSGTTGDVRQEAKYRFLNHFDTLLTRFKQRNKQIIS